MGVFSLVVLFFSVGLICQRQLLGSIYFRLLKDSSSLRKLIYLLRSCRDEFTLIQPTGMMTVFGSYHMKVIDARSWGLAARIMLRMQILCCRPSSRSWMRYLCKSCQV